MDCFLLGNDDEFTKAKWNLLCNAAKGVWKDNYILNGNFQDFMKKTTDYKVLILACHCHFNEDGTERWFYYDENPDFQLSRTEIEECFWGLKTCQRLFVWVLTCESANVDVWFNYRNEVEKRENSSTRAICTRVIAAECGAGKKIKMTDPYILKMLQCVVEDPSFSVTDFQTGYSSCHLEYPVLRDGFKPSNDDGFMVYGMKDLLRDWIAKLEKDKCKLKEPIAWSTFICWSSVDTQGAYSKFQIHDHHAECSKTKNRILNCSYHAKSGDCSVNVDSNYKSLCEHLKLTGDACLKSTYDTKSSAAAIPAEYRMITDKERRNQEFKNQIDKKEDK
jgi:hypothetical protein